MVYGPKWYQNKIILKFMYPTSGIRKSIQTFLHSYYIREPCVFIHTYGKDALKLGVLKRYEFIYTVLLCPSRVRVKGESERE